MANPGSDAGFHGSWSSAPWQRTAQGANLMRADGQPGTTIFEEITALALRTGAINLGQGFPDTDSPLAIREDAQQAIGSGANQYAPGAGNPVLRTAVAEHILHWYGLEHDPDREVLVSTGATEAIAASILAFCDRGDEVITFEPFYDSYGAMIALSGARHITVPLLPPPASAPSGSSGGSPPGWTFDPQHLTEAFSQRTRLVLLNTPHNPTGTAFGAEDLQRIVELAERYGALIISDEVYEHLRFGGEHQPVATIPGARERTITISSAGKTFSLTGWKIGWATGPAELISAVRTVKQFLSYSSGAPFQAAIATALSYPDDYFHDISRELSEKADFLSSALTGSGFIVHRPQAGYFTVADLGSAELGSDQPGAAEPDTATWLAARLPGLIGVAAVPVSAFCQPGSAYAGRYRGLLRFAFCKRPEVLRDAAQRLGQLLPRLTGSA